MNADSTRDQALSDLADGRASAAQLDSIMAAWNDQPDLRRQWQTLHLIGDTLRSAELANQVQDSDALLAGLRERIAQEPVPLRPRRLRDWMAPLAVAAGFVAVAMVVPSLNPMLQPAGLPAIARADALQPLGLTINGAEPSFVQAAGLRDATLDLAPQAASAVTFDPARR